MDSGDRESSGEVDTILAPPLNPVSSPRHHAAAGPGFPRAHSSALPRASSFEHDLLNSPLGNLDSPNIMAMTLLPPGSAAAASPAATGAAAACPWSASQASDLPEVRRLVRRASPRKVLHEFTHHFQSCPYRCEHCRIGIFLGNRIWKVPSGEEADYPLCFGHFCTSCGALHEIKSSNKKDYAAMRAVGGRLLRPDPHDYDILKKLIVARARIPVAWFNLSKTCRERETAGPPADEDDSRDGG